mgnify:CR=1 FL=1|jgi:hypothetical protein
MTIRCRMACGHVIDWEDGVEAPRCPCGETRVGGTTAAPPHFRGCCDGPLATREDLEALPVPMPKGVA